MICNEMKCKHNQIGVEYEPMSLNFRMAKLSLLTAVLQDFF